MPNVEPRLAGQRIDADETERQAEEQAGSPFSIESRPARRTPRRTQERSARSTQRDRSGARGRPSWPARSVSATVASVPATNEPIAAVASAAAAAGARHQVAFDGGHDRRALARRVQQDRRRRSAVHPAVVDAGEHDERLDRLQAEGHGQQQGDGQGRTDPGSTPTSVPSVTPANAHNRFTAPARRGIRRRARSAHP